MPVSVQPTQIVFNDSTIQTTAFTGAQQLQFSLALRTSAVNSSGIPLTYSGTPGTLTFTAPAGVTRVQVTVYGGGGAGGSAATDGNDWWNGGNGGDGGFAYGLYTVIPGTAYSVSVGVGGTGSGGAGGSSSFSTLISATGGSGGGNASVGNNGSNGAAGAGSSGNIRNLTGIPAGMFTGTASSNSNPQIFSPSGAFGAGVGGSGGDSNSSGGRGGTSGLVLIQYVG